MKTYCYDEYYHVHEREWIEPVEKTEDQIIAEFWDYWYAKMITKYGEGDELITKENCIEDWCTIHGAWEKKDA